MSDFGNIGDFLPQTEVPCRVRGCTNTVKISGEAAMQNVAMGRSPHQARMCDECYAQLQTLQDREMPCSKPGCEGKWIWTRLQQLEAQKQGRKHGTPRGYCETCRNEMKHLETEKFPCRIKGCKNQWTLSAREKFELNGKRPPSRMCEECFQQLNRLQDKEIPCRVHGCKHTWTWNRYQQLEHLRAGKSLENPPSKMCSECFQIFQSLENQEIPCRVRGCKNTCTWTAFDQLEAILAAQEKGLPPRGLPAAPAAEAPAAEAPAAEAPAAEAPAAEAPAAEAPAAEAPAADPVAEKKRLFLAKYPEVKPPIRMCKECYTFWSGTKDVEQPCRMPGCQNTWIWTRSSQLAMKLRGKTNPPSHLCEECTKKLEALQDEKRKCMTEGCSGEWVYPREEQLRDQNAKRTPKPRRCLACSEFLAQHKELMIHCAECGADIRISALQQLQIARGTQQMPTLCTECTKKKLDSVLPGPGIPSEGTLSGDAPARE